MSSADGNLGRGELRLLARLGRGGSGEVWLAERAALGGETQRLVVKRLNTLGDDARKVMRDEVAVLAQLDHPNVVRLIDAYPHGDDLLILLEHVAGLSGDELILRNLRPPLGVIARLGAALGRGLAAVHNLRSPKGHLLGVVHRDIHPGNVMVGFDGSVKILDFGSVDHKDRSASATAHQIKGRAAFLAPEQVSSTTVDLRADIFSAATTLYALLLGYSPFARDDLSATFYALTHLSAPSLEQFFPEAPPALTRVFKVALARDASQRFPDAALMADAFEAVADQLNAPSLAQWTGSALAEAHQAHLVWLQTLAPKLPPIFPSGEALSFHVPVDDSNKPSPLKVLRARPWLWALGLLVPVIGAGVVHYGLEPAPRYQQPAQEITFHRGLAHWRLDAVGWLAVETASGALEVNHATSPPGAFLYDLDVDRGHQMWWPLQTEAQGDFELSFEVEVEAYEPNDTFGAWVGLVKKDGGIVAAAGYVTPTSRPCEGAWNGRIHWPGADEYIRREAASPPWHIHYGAARGAFCRGHSTIAIRRRQGVIRITQDRDILIYGENREPVAALAVIAAGHRNYSFGTFRVHWMRWRQ